MSDPDRFARAQVKSTPRVHTTSVAMIFQEIRGPSGGLAVGDRLRLLFGFDLALRQPSQHPEVVREHRPVNRQLPVPKAFAADGRVQEVVNDNADPAFGLGATALQFNEFPRTQALLQLVRVTRTNAIVNFLFLQPFLDAGAVKAAIGPSFFNLDF